MGLRRLFQDIGELRRGFIDLAAPFDKEDEQASYDLAVSTSRFARRTQRVMDDKLAFSATLMRAGEVVAATRLLAEVEADVRTEEAALLEQVNEVKAAHSLRKEKLTRLRLARMVATAMAGAVLLSFSAIGISLAGMLSNDSPIDHAATTSRSTSSGTSHGAHSAGTVLSRRLHRIRINGVALVLTDSQFSRIKRLAGTSDVDGDSLQQMLTLLPEGLAEKVQATLAAGVETADTVQQVVKDAVGPVQTQVVVRDKKKKVDDSETDAPKDEPSPEPSSSPRDDGSNSDGGSSGGGGGSDDGGGLPLLSPGGGGSGGATGQ
jgi:uncharacterized membrane protein YgcG